MAASRNSGSPEARCNDRLPLRAVAGRFVTRPPADPVPAAVAAVLAQAGVGPGSTLCCALSGGVDSVVLLNLLATLQAKLGYRLAAAHVHHGLSPNADGWLAFCERTCGALGVSFQGFRVLVPRDDPAGLEAAARRVRHEALAGVPCDWLVFGHHQDDQAETVFFRLLRGAGVRGAAAMAAIEGGRPRRLRPLLGQRRAELVAWARAHGLSWIEDESNADQRYTRNVLRHRVLPEVEAVFPAAIPALARAAMHFGEASELLDELAAIDEAGCGGRLLDRARLLALSDARVRNLLRWQTRALGAEAPAQARLAEALRQLREIDALRPLHLPLGVIALCSYRGQVWLERLLPPAGEPRTWNGERELDWCDGRIRFVPVIGGGLAASALGQATALRLSTRWPGLAMRTHPRRPLRSFKNLCQEAGIPVWLRERLPVLAVDGEPAWIGEVGISPAFVCPADEAGLVPVWERVA